MGDETNIKIIVNDNLKNPDIIVINQFKNTIVKNPHIIKKTQTFHHPRGGTIFFDPDKLIEAYDYLPNVNIGHSVFKNSKIYYANINGLDQNKLTLIKDYSLATNLPRHFIPQKISYHSIKRNQYFCKAVVNVVTAIAITFVMFAATSLTAIPAMSICVSGAFILCNLPILLHDQVSNFNHHLVEKLKWETRQKNALAFEKNFTHLSHAISASDHQGNPINNADPAFMTKHNVRVFTDNEYAKLRILMHYAAQNPDQPIFIMSGKIPKHYETKQAQNVIPLQNNRHILPLKK